MLKIICMYYLMGMLITLCIAWKDLTEDVHSESEWIGTIIAILILAWGTPVLIVYGFFKAIYDQIREES